MLPKEEKTKDKIRKLNKVGINDFESTSSINKETITAANDIRRIPASLHAPILKSKGNKNVKEISILFIVEFLFKQDKALTPVSFYFLI